MDAGHNLAIIAADFEIRGQGVILMVDSELKLAAAG
jgi:hypothetical protein